MFFNKLEQTLHAFNPQIHSPKSHQAAVLLMLTDELSPQLIYAKRAAHLTHHAGEICFPGGMWENTDENLLETALRETHEELGVSVEFSQVIGVLPSRITRGGTQVLPVIAKVPQGIQPIPNPQELDEVFRVSLDAISSLQIRIDHFERNGAHYSIPVYAYEHHEIWGFTALVTQDLLKTLE